MKSAPAEFEVDVQQSEETTLHTVSAPDNTKASTELRDSIHLSIGDDVARVNRILDQHLQSPHQYMGDVLQHAGQFRGKQIRPVLLLLCQKAIAGRTDETARTLAAVVQMIHTATLVHDDVLDDASSRRHMPTINREWDTETSVLLGDYLFSRAFRLAASTGDAAACEFIGHATDLTCAAELHQIAACRDRSRSERDYFRVIRGKTGQLFGLGCHLGARAAQASINLQRQMQIAGIELGMAFQIADDVLDLTGKESQTGKDSGNDVANRRLTLPLLRTLRLASGAEYDEIQRLLNGDHVDESYDGRSDSHQRLATHAAVQEGIASANQTARHLISRCMRRLNLLPHSEDRSLLQSIAGFAVRRQA